MQYWSIRTIEELEILQSGKILTTNSEKVDDYHIPAYQWMIKQLIKRVEPPPNGVIYPIWVWRYCHSRTKPKPDLRYGGYDRRGEKRVLLSLEIPETKVLLSDFDGWHAVLNEWYQADDEADWYRFDALEKTLSPQMRRKLIEESWHKIFDWQKLPDEYAVQGVTWQILPTYVIDYKIFTCR